MKTNKLLKPAENQMAYLKAGILGFPGSGKTFTASIIARGIYQMTKADKPVAFLDTETGTDFEISRFKAAGIPLVVFKSRAFADLLKVVQEAESDCSVLIIDSISHCWTELLTAFQKQKKVERLLFHHWGPIKAEWRQFTDLYLNSKLHIVMCGRAGWEYDYEEAEDGHKELIKTGTKMRAETEMGYEPSLLLEMQLVREDKVKIGAKPLHRCHVLKDRSDQINGRHFDNPDFNAFLPHLASLNIGGDHLAIEARSSDGMFQSGESLYQKNKAREIVAEELKNELYLQLPGNTEDTKRKRMLICRSIFETDSWKAIEDKDSKVLRRGLTLLRKLFHQCSSEDTSDTLLDVLRDLKTETDASSKDMETDLDV